eukprot:CAMPEP_0204180902 /NCGR_PEP_ID=MMETSP0361-20130328/51414_1 /ASSEMBLY_ACC=CAM_ASM_000343 /TAXON_ID=268821 /ORGANISM="Scrippsiella Hangoei, Strain SHTV-5" /LENGTH=454 /DNA_ID=CAMNT_0051140393 /DNA_START=18 /DNA_END=1379 /DNA_ORIENTATION=+
MSIGRAHRKDGGGFYVFVVLYAFHVSRLILWAAGQQSITRVAELGAVGIWIGLPINGLPLILLSASMHGIMSFQQGGLLTLAWSEIMVPGLFAFRLRYASVEEALVPAVMTLPWCMLNYFATMRCFLVAICDIPPRPWYLQWLPAWFVSLLYAVQMAGSHQDSWVSGFICVALNSAVFGVFGHLGRHLMEAKLAMQQQRDDFMSLLDVATDGFCSVRRAGPGDEVGGMGKLTLLSGKLQRTLRVQQPLHGEAGCEGAGVDVADVLASTADIARFAEMLDGFAEEETGSRWLGSCLVTCVAPPRCSSKPSLFFEEFEVRLFSFRAPEGPLQICFQVASERRESMQDQSSLAAAASPDESAAALNLRRRARGGDDSPLSSPVPTSPSAWDLAGSEAGGSSLAFSASTAPAAPLVTRHLLWKGSSSRIAEKDDPDVRSLADVGVQTVHRPGACCICA